MALRLMMTADAVGGVWTYALDLARGIAEAGGETTLCVLGPAPSRDLLDEATAVSNLRLVLTGLALDWTARTPAELDAAVEAVEALARNLRPDIIHLNSPALAPASGLLLLSGALRSMFHGSSDGALCSTNNVRALSQNVCGGLDSASRRDRRR